MSSMLSQTKKFFVALIGFSLLIIGLLLLVFPGPGLLIIIGGLVVLASEFAWAKSALAKARRKYDEVKQKVRSN